MLRRVVVVALFAAFAAAFAAGGCARAGLGGERRVRLPAGLPADVPLPERAALRAARDMGEDGLNLVFETDDSVAMVQERLRARLAAGGWTLLSEAAVGSAEFTSYGKGARSVALGVSRSGDVTVVGLAYWQP